MVPKSWLAGKCVRACVFGMELLPLLLSVWDGEGGVECSSSSARVPRPGPDGPRLQEHKDMQTCEVGLRTGSRLLLVV